MKKSTVFSLVFFSALLCPLVAGSQQRTGPTTYAVSPGGQLQMKVSGGDVVIEAWAKNEVSVEAVGIDPSRLRVEQQGNMISVEYEERGRSSGVEFHIQVPDAFNLDLKMGGGDVEINGDLTGEVRVATAGGDIDFDSILGTLDIRTSGGDVKGADVSAEVSVQSQGGDIELGSALGPVHVSTQGGDVHVEGAGSELVVRTQGGDVVVGNVEGVADVTSQGGDLKIGRVGGSVTLKTAGGDVHLAGAGGEVSVKTAGGDLRLEGLEGPVDAKTAGGDVFAQIVSVTGSSDFSSAGGDITIEVGAAATVHATIRIQGNWERNKQEHRISGDASRSAYNEDPDRQEITATYEINGGGPVINVTTVNGSIEVRPATLR